MQIENQKEDPIHENGTKFISPMILNNNMKRAKSSSNLFNRKSAFPPNFINQPNPVIKDILSKMMEVKKVNQKLQSTILLDKEVVEKKDRLIEDVKLEKEHLEKENKFLMENYNQIEKLKEVCDKNKQSVIEYHKQLSHQYEDCTHVLQTYERTIKELKNEIEFIEKSSLGKLDKIGKVKQEIENEIQNLKETYERQQAEIKQLEMDVEMAKKMKEHEKRQNDEMLKAEGRDMKDLQWKFQTLQKKVQEFKIKEEQVNESDSNGKNPPSNIPHLKEELEIKLGEQRQQNLVLLEQIRSMNAEIEDARKKKLLEEEERKQEEIQRRLAEEKARLLQMEQNKMATIRRLHDPNYKGLRASKSAAQLQSGDTKLEGQKSKPMGQSNSKQSTSKDRKSKGNSKQNTKR